MGKWPQLKTLFERNNLNGKWPPNRGFITEREIKLKIEDKTVFNRYGGYTDSETSKLTAKGTFAAPEKVPFGRSQKATRDKSYNRYQFIKDILERFSGQFTNFLV